MERPELSCSRAVPHDSLTGVPMKRRLAFTLSLVLGAAVPALAQSHPVHAGSHPHDSLGHASMDSAQHAALHALMHGSWVGTASSAHAGPSAMNLTVAQDDRNQVVLKL